MVPPSPNISSRGKANPTGLPGTRSEVPLAAAIASSDRTIRLAIGGMIHDDHAPPPSPDTRPPAGRVWAMPG